MEIWDARRALASVLAGDQARRLMRALGLPPVPKQDRGRSVRIGILGASKVATYALIWPARRMEDVEVVAVAARDADRAQQYAQQHGIPCSYGSYEALVEDPSLDAIYVALPNGAHGEWTARALEAGKHVLCEKPFTANAEEARAVQQLSHQRGLLAREAFHYKEHPANRQVRALLQGGAIGQLRHLEARVLIPRGIFGQGDIRFNPSLAGGTMMDAGCYCAHALRFFGGAKPRVTAAAPQAVVAGSIDQGMQATFEYPVGTGWGAGGSAVPLTGPLEASLAAPGLFPVSEVRAEGSRGRLVLRNFVVPFVGHDIELTRRDDIVGQDTTVHLRAYGSGESNYTYQLRRFITDLQVLEGGREAGRQLSEAHGGGSGKCQRTKKQVWEAMQEDARDATENMELVDSVYTAAGLAPRQPSRAWGGASWQLGS